MLLAGDSYSSIKIITYFVNYGYYIVTVSIYLD